MQDAEKLRIHHGYTRVLVKEGPTRTTMPGWEERGREGFPVSPRRLNRICDPSRANFEFFAAAMPQGVFLGGEHLAPESDVGEPETLHPTP